MDKKAHFVFRRRKTLEYNLQGKKGTSKKKTERPAQVYL